MLYPIFAKGNQISPAKVLLNVHKLHFTERYPFPIVAYVTIFHKSPSMVAGGVCSSSSFVCIRNSPAGCDTPHPLAQRTLGVVRLCLPRYNTTLPFRQEK